MATPLSSTALTSVLKVRKHLHLDKFGAKDEELIRILINQMSALMLLDINYDVVQTTYTEYHSGNGRDKVIYLLQRPIIRVTRLAVGRYDVLKVTNTTSQSTAFVRVTSTGLVLTLDGIEDSTVLFATYATLATVVTAINAIGSGWSSELVSSDYNSFKSTELIETYNLGCIDSGYAYLQIPREAKNSYYYDEDEAVVWQDYAFTKGSDNIRVDYVAGYVAVPDDIVLACNKAVEYEYIKIKSGLSGVVTKGLTTTGEQTTYQRPADGSVFIPEIQAIVDKHRRIPV